MRGWATKPVPESQTLSVTVRSGGLDLVGITMQLVPASRQMERMEPMIRRGLMRQPGIKFQSKARRSFDLEAKNPVPTFKRT